MRLKKIAISTYLMFELLSKDWSIDIDGINSLKVIPKNSTLKYGYYDPGNNTFVLVFENPNFEDINYLSSIPFLLENK